jgi:RimJ/RimL family protein N-acetyltransferase
MQTPTKPILRGGRVVLRPLTADDAEAMYASLDDPVSMRLTGTHAKFSFEDVQAHCARIERAEDRWDCGTMVGGDLIGEVVLNNVDWANQCASFRIAIWTAEKRNKGYGTDSTSMLLGFGFETLALNRIELEVYAFNPQARRVYEKLGFRLEGTRREALIWHGERAGAHIMSMLRREFSHSVHCRAAPQT